MTFKSPILDNNKLYVLDSEIESGNIEYKRKLINCSNNRITRLQNQMLWRLNEGYNKVGIFQAIYYIGIDDDGSMSNLTIDEHDCSIKTLELIASKCDSKIIKTEIVYKNNSIYSKNIIQKNNIIITNNNIIKIALLGDENCGKSTMLGVLTRDCPDNGNGSSRINVSRYDHEIKQGKTSSINYELLGYKGNVPINYNTIGSSFININQWQYIVENSDKLIYFIDLPGATKFLKTSIFGIMAHKPNYIMILIDINDMINNIIGTNTINNIILCNSLEIKVIFVLTKIDLANVSDKTKSFVLDKICNIYNHNNLNYSNIHSIIFLSNKTLDGYNNLHNILSSINIQDCNNKIDNKNDDKIDNKIDLKKNVEFMINHVFYISDIGIVVMGILYKGIIEIGDSLFIGPHNGNMFPVEIISIHKKQIPHNYISTSETASIVIKINNHEKITKHMMIMTNNNFTNITDKFNFKVNKNKFSHDLINTLKTNKNINLMIYTYNICDIIKISNYHINNDHIIISALFDNKKYIKNNEPIIIKYNNNFITGQIL